MSVTSKHLILGSALLFAALPALASEENTPGAAPVAPAAAPNAVVKCPGVTNIPFTADQEQALPLNLVGTLSCGEPVTVLSNQEGYTAQIRTKDGVVGYVAQMYLATDAVPKMIQRSAQASAKPVNGVVRWFAGAAGCDEFLSHDRHVESITAGGITVQVSIQDSGWKYRANVAVSNESGDHVLVLPGIITLDELAPNLRALLATDAARIAHEPTHQVFWTLADAVPSRSAVADYSAVSESDRLANRTSPAPDYLNPHLALASSHHVMFERTQSIDVQSVALKSGNVPSGQLTAGVMWFERDPNAHELSLRVPVGNLVFDFPFSLEQKK